MPYDEALALYERGEYAAAALAFERFLAAAPGHAEARYKLGNARSELGEWEAAAGHYRAALAIDPGHAMARNNLGAAEQVLGRPLDAEACYRGALERDPRLAQPWANLGRLLQSQGRHQEAAALYRQALEAGQDAGYFGHLADAASGQAGGQAGGRTNARAPASYVRGTFDAFATRFDRHLVEGLDYRVPELLAAMAHEAFAKGGLDVLDLGCGTGLAGAALRALAHRLVGVDLSTGMLEAARQRGCYDALHAADILDWLQASAAGCFDLIVAADVFIYIGDLAGVFADIARVLRPGGGFAFSVENTARAGWQLTASGRYAHGAGYVLELAAANSFAPAGNQRVQVRRGVAGELHLLRRA